ncbi:MAG: hypothetical protein ACFE9S_07565 [Candidatus Hermodarchaeota archaeon]
MNCEIGELKVFYRGWFDVKIHQSIADAIKQFGYELECIDYDGDKHIASFQFKKDCG